MATKPVLQAAPPGYAMAYSSPLSQYFIDPQTNQPAPLNVLEAKIPGIISLLAFNDALLRRSLPNSQYYWRPAVVLVESLSQTSARSEPNTVSKTNVLSFHSQDPEARAYTYNCIVAEFEFRAFTAGVENSDEDNLLRGVCLYACLQREWRARVLGGGEDLKDGMPVLLDLGSQWVLMVAACNNLRKRRAEERREQERKEQERKEYMSGLLELGQRREEGFSQMGGGMRQDYYPEMER